MKNLKQKFLHNLPQVAFASLRFCEEKYEYLRVRQDVLEPVESGTDRGAMITVIEDNGAGYAATNDLTEQGIIRAVSEARKWAALSRKYTLIDYSAFESVHPKGEYKTPVQKPWNSLMLDQKTDLLKSVSEKLRISDLIVDWETSIQTSEVCSFYVTSGGGEIFQQFSYLLPDISVTANRGSETHTRTISGVRGYCRQGGLEVIDEMKFREAGTRIAEQAAELLDAPDCPAGNMDILLDPSQMMLQIHESIGHPLEIDRILGDERNYAGTSFVKPGMFGTYKYGSDLLNITFDPSVGQFASYGFDDEGASARKEYIIEKGILKRGLGGRLSQYRSGIPGVACSRADGWDRPPIDRIANLNLETGESAFEEMVACVEKGVYMDTNTSWSIDDSRNNFQFGCEWARLIENGKLTTVVKKPNYRGISASFWRNLKMVGNKDTVKIFGAPYCGKGEPNQIIHVGHASPACLFSNVDVFGGE
ncbi:MAG: TldD/PmbA family protein [Desulfobacterales bacterium]|nr:TldD/PmbA family protein [Desulfobacterales bacterium]